MIYQSLKKNNTKTKLTWNLTSTNHRLCKNICHLFATTKLQKLLCLLYLIVSIKKGIARRVKDQKRYAFLKRSLHWGKTCNRHICLECQKLKATFITYFFPLSQEIPTDLNTLYSTWNPWRQIFDGRNQPINIPLHHSETPCRCCCLCWVIFRSESARLTTAMGVLRLKN